MTSRRRTFFWAGAPRCQQCRRRCGRKRRRHAHAALGGRDQDRADGEILVSPGPCQTSSRPCSRSCRSRARLLAVGAPFPDYAPPPDMVERRTDRRRHVECRDERQRGSPKPGTTIPAQRRDEACSHAEPSGESAPSAPSPPPRSPRPEEQGRPARGRARFRRAGPRTGATARTRCAQSFARHRRSRIKAGPTGPARRDRARSHRPP